MLDVYRTLGIQMTGWPAALSVAGFGATVAIGGLLYGVFTVGVPYPDPTPAQAAAEKANLTISAWAMGGGIFVFLIGLLMLFALAVAHVVAIATNQAMRQTPNQLESENPVHGS